MPPELLVTDFAGTTLRDDGVVLAAYHAALTAHAIPYTESDLAAARGASKRAVFTALAGRKYAPRETDAIAAQALGTFETALARAYAEGEVQEMRGAADTVRVLKAAGMRVALASGFDRGLMDMLLDRLGWTALFDLTVSATDVPQGRPAPYAIFHAMMALGIHDVRRVAVVGDTPLDLQAGCNAAAGWVIGVLGGAHGLDTLGATPHTHLLPGVAALPALFAL